MATLYELDRTVSQIIETGFAFDEETGEVLFDYSDLEELQLALADKLESCGLWIKNQSAMAKAIREEEKELAERRRRIESKLERMDDYVRATLSKVGGKFETPKVKLTTRKSTRTVIVDESSVPDDFKTEVVTTKFDKTKISKAIKAGQQVPGAMLVESENLQVK